LEQRIEKGFSEYIKRSNFNDEQIKVLDRIKNILAQNYVKNKRLNPDDIFSSPVYEQIIGRKEDLKNLFPDDFEVVLHSLESAIH
ncbi:MAG: type I restriction-modification enzyme R subunit C-terminal domain-containing protein, partial [Bacteroidota bacterium]